jgi:enterochelin esterase-like enzyme
MKIIMRDPYSGSGPFTSNESIIISYMKKILNITFWIFLLAYFHGEQTSAQPGRHWLRSPEILPDDQVIFRYYAPAAGSVELRGEFLPEPVKLARDSTGIWSVTTGPVKPDIYPYSFLVDGVPAADPNNPLTFPNERFKRSLVDIPGDPPLLHSLQDVPHGTVSYRYYHSASLGLIRPLVIYTPPGYEEKSRERYPVLYLIHGMTDTEETWTKVGRANLILDNLISAGKAVPMIIVMPYANPYPDLLKKDPATQVNLLDDDVFTRELLKEIIPFIEKNYRVKSDAVSRAIAGFSLGGRQSLAAGLGHPEVFSWVFAYSPAIWQREFDDNFADRYASPETLNSRLKMLWLSCGTDEGLYQSVQAFLELLDRKDIKHKAFLTGGGHTWMNCRAYLEETARLLFK